DGSIVMWGYSSRSSAPPTNVIDIAQISIGGSPQTSPNNLVLRSDGAVVNWVSTAKSSTISNQNIVAIAAGAAHQLALRDDGTVLAWGSNNFGQTNVPPEATNIIAIAAGANHSLALRADRVVFGWGLNTQGQATA